MWKPSTNTGILLVLSGILALGSIACSSDTPESSPSPQASLPPKPQQPQAKPRRPLKAAASATPSPSPNSDAYNRAVDAATGAVTISQSAVSREDWQLVANHWQQAVNFLKSVPSSSPQRQMAAKKLPQYQRFLAEAKQKATPVPKKTQQGDVNPQFFSIPIKGRVGGTPIVEVNFNGTRKFEMLFDTGATGTLITAAMAESLRLKPVGITKSVVADGAIVTLPLAELNTVEIDGRLKRKLRVAVAPPAMPIGLLGQDFFEGYDISIKENVIELRRR
jgi:predicted aspartyl protease